MRTFWALAFFGWTAVAGPALADSQSVDAAIGGAVGGGLGALIGNELTGRNGAILGGALGAAAGAAVATEDEGPRYRTRDDGYERSYYYHPPGPGGFCPPGLAKQGRC